MKHLQACLRATKDGECSFHHSGSVMKLVQACLSARKDRESGLHHCGGRVSLFKCREGPTMPFPHL